ncbi:mannosyltransferase [Coemansia sp. S2]|nr:mannosyltransferase [Coemansia sp. S2]
MKSRSSSSKARQRNANRGSIAETNVRGAGQRVAVLVLGDIGRSPRMQYHALSLAKAGHSVDLIGYPGSTPMEGILASPNITIRHLPTPPQPPPSAPRVLFYLFAPLKVVYQLVVLFWTILATIKHPEFILVQVCSVSGLVIDMVLAVLYGLLVILSIVCLSRTLRLSQRSWWLASARQSPEPDLSSTGTTTDIRYSD